MKVVSLMIAPGLQSVAKPTLYYRGKASLSPRRKPWKRPSCSRGTIACRRPPADNFRAELEDGSWTIIKVGDGQVSGLAESDDPSRFYETMARCPDRLDG